MHDINFTLTSDDFLFALFIFVLFAILTVGAAIEALCISIKRKRSERMIREAYSRDTLK